MATQHQVCQLQASSSRGMHAAGRTGTASAASNCKQRSTTGQAAPACEAAAEAASRAADALIAEEAQAAAAAQQAKQQAASKKARQKQRKQVGAATACALVMLPEPSVFQPCSSPLVQVRDLHENTAQAGLLAKPTIMAVCHYVH